MNRPARLVPDVPLPPYAYVPSGPYPHPTSDPRGHSHQKHALAGSNALSYGIDLFNNGFYWEAHEAWETLWRRYERHSEIWRFLQGLIKLAAACVKIREGVADGARNHANRALELFAGLPESVERLKIAELQELAAAIAETPPTHDPLPFVIRIQYP